MFDIAWSELALIGAVALIVIGPKDLPKVMRTAGKWTRKARLLAGELQRNFDDMVHQADLDDVRQQVQSVTPSAMKAHVEKMVGADALRDAMSGPGAMAAAASLKPAEPVEVEVAVKADALPPVKSESQP